MMELADMLREVIKLFLIQELVAQNVDRVSSTQSLTLIPYKFSYLYQHSPTNSAIYIGRVLSVSGKVKECYIA